MFFHLSESKTMSTVIQDLSIMAGLNTCTPAISAKLEEFARLIISDMKTRASNFSDTTGSNSLDECLGNAELQMLEVINGHD